MSELRVFSSCKEALANSQASEKKLKDVLLWAAHELNNDRKPDDVVAKILSTLGPEVEKVMT